MNTVLLAPLPPDFLPDLLMGVVVNFRIAILSLLLGMMMGAPLAAGCAGQGGWRAVPRGVVELMGAAPTFMVMFFLLNVVPRDLVLFGQAFRVSGEFAVIVSLVPYSASYVAQNGAVALQEWRRGARGAALLLLPNLARAFFVLVMASSAGAAIGVTEGITVIRREADHLHSLPERLRLFAIGIAVFAMLLHGGFALVSLLRRRLEARFSVR
jgi:hypothetical protein